MAPYHHCRARPRVADGRTASNMEGIFNKQSRTANKGWSSSLGVGRVVKLLTIKISCYEKFTKKASDLD